MGCDFGNIGNTLHLMNTCTTELNNWFLMNGLCLNPSKSESIFLGTGAQVNKAKSHSSILVADNAIVVAREIKSLGVVLDEKLSFDAHVDKICKAAQYHIRALRHIRQSLSTEVAKSVACSIVGSRVDYCNSLLIGISAKNINKLQKIQNTVARVITGHRKFDHITPVLKDLHWLPIKSRLKFKLSTIVFKTLSSNQPAYLRELMHHPPLVRTLRSTENNYLVVPRCKTVIASRAFSIAAPTVWNEIPVEIRNSTSLLTFKKKLKTFFFDQSFM